MSNMYNDLIADNAIDTVAAMSNAQVAMNLDPANLKRVAAFTGGGSPMDFARDVLTEQVFEELIERPGPCG